MTESNLTPYLHPSHCIDSKAPAVRAFTAELNQSIGLAWPFSLAHCRAPSTPGCGRHDPRPASIGRAGLHAGWLAPGHQRDLLPR